MAKKEKMPTVIRPGRAKGNIIDQNARNSLAPSISADSCKLEGNDLKKPVKMKIAKGIPNAT